MTVLADFRPLPLPSLCFRRYFDACPLPTYFAANVGHSELLCRAFASNFAGAMQPIDFVSTSSYQLRHPREEMAESVYLE